MPRRRSFSALTPRGTAAVPMVGERSFPELSSIAMHLRPSALPGGSPIIEMQPGPI